MYSRPERSKGPPEQKPQRVPDELSCELTGAQILLPTAAQPQHANVEAATAEPSFSDE